MILLILQTVFESFILISFWYQKLLAFLFPLQPLH